MTDKTRTITLTDHRPVTIVEEEWPRIASDTDDSWPLEGGVDYARHQQASAQGELDEYSLTVRQHADGRVIVYGVFSAATAWTGSEDHRGGEMGTKENNLAFMIRRVGEYCKLPDRVIRNCIADLPPIIL